MGEKVAVVSGGNRGIGKEVCRQLAEKGCRVVLTARSEDKGRAAAKDLANAGDVLFHYMDVSKPAEIGKCAAWVAEEFGRCDILVNNAGILIDTNEGSEQIIGANLDPIRKSFEVNTIGPIAVTNAFLPVMKKNDYGRIVNVSSGMGQLSDMGGRWAGYRLSKTALNAATRIFAAELSGTNIKINSVCPGWVRTEMGGPDAKRSPTEGASGIVEICLIEDDGPSGGFFRDGKPIEW